MRVPAASPPFPVLRLYYLAGTPAFALADWILGLPIRVAGIHAPGLRLSYYAVLVLLGLLVLLRPGWGPWIGMAESAGNLLLLFLSILLPLWALPDLVAEGGELAVPFGAAEVLNVLIVGGVLVGTFHRSAFRALAGPRSPRSP
jgi:hypothetical protein